MFLPGFDTSASKPINSRIFRSESLYAQTDHGLSFTVVKQAMAQGYLLFMRGFHQET